MFIWKKHVEVISQTNLVLVYGHSYLVTFRLLLRVASSKSLPSKLPARVAPRTCRRSPQSSKKCSACSSYRSGFALSSLETTLKSWRNPESPRDNTWQSLGWFYHVTRCLWWTPQVDGGERFSMGNHPPNDLFLWDFNLGRHIAVDPRSNKFWRNKKNENNQERK